MEFWIKAAQLFLSLAILVTLHELGHFLPAKLFKTRVEKFYLFFNPWFSIFRTKKLNGKRVYSWFSKDTPKEWAGEPDKTEQETDNSGIVIKPKKSGKNKIKSRNAWKYNSKRNFLMINFGDKFSIIIQLVKINNYIEVTFITQLKGELFNGKTLQNYHPTIGVI